MEEKKLKRRKERAINEGNEDALYHSCKELADDYLRDERNEEALNEYKEAEKAAKKLGNRYYVAITNRMIGETYCALGEFDKAIVHQKIHLQYARNENNLIEEQRALATLGRTYFVQAESFSDNETNERAESLSLSHKYYSKSLNICEKLPLSNQLGQKTLAEMKCRLFLNLGLTSEAEGNSETALGYISKAIAISKSMELWEDLFRCYAAEGSIHFRRGSTSKALLAYDKGHQAAERCEKRIQLSCELLSLKSDVLIMLSDYNGAKNALIKAYKMKTPDPKDRKDIEKKLRIVILICKNEKLLLDLPQSDYTSRKEVNEKLGDLCVKLESYERAIQYYIATLKCAESMGLQGNKLSPIYYSLSQTYKDNKQYELSVEYSRKEFELIKDNPAEACQTLLNMTDTMELMREPFDKLMENYKRCLTLAKKSKDFKIEATVLKNMLHVQKAYGREDLAEETKQELDVIECCLPNTDEGTEPSDVEVMEDEIDLDELSDIGSDEDEDPLNQDKRIRRRPIKSSITRRNEKGETPLHVASAKGNVPLIKSLVKQGHPVNIPDAAGWSPLHEACNHGQIEAVKVLIELGANIDDRGGPSCDGITPLLDAASNGHLELITLLLDKGASPLAKSNQGDTVLDCLLACQERATAQGETLDYETQIYFEKVVKRLKECYDKVGQTHTTLSNKSTNTGAERDMNRPRTALKMQKIRTLRRDESWSQAIDESRKRTECKVTEQSTSVGGAKEYKDAIEALRRRNKNDTIHNEPLKKVKKNALLAEEEVGDNWLDDDMRGMMQPLKRRRENFVGQQLRQSKKSESFDSVSCKSLKSPSLMMWDDDSNDDDDLFGNVDIPKPQQETKLSSPEIEFHYSPPAHRSQEARPTAKQQRQESLTSMNFQRFRPSNSSTQSSEEHSLASGLQSEPPPSVANKSVSGLRAIKVRVESKLFLVPIPQCNDTLSIGWLANETSRRYQNSEGVTPVLNLTTIEGALLDSNDPLSIILNDSEVCGTVLSWKLKPLSESYREACSAANVDVDSYLERRLEMCQSNECLSIEDRRLSTEILNPVFKAIQHCQTMRHICISSVFLLDHDFKVLVDHISKFAQMQSLNISVNHITNDGLSHLARTISSGSLRNLHELNISYNPLGEDCGQTLYTLSQHLPFLQSLKLRCVGLSPKCLQGSWFFEFTCLETLDISFNELNRESISKFLAALDSERVRSLNASHAGGCEVFREVILFLDRGGVNNLEELFLASLNATDEDVQGLAQALARAPRLRKLNLSNNRRITTKSHQSLSQIKTLRELCLSGCTLVPGSHQLSLTLDKLTLSSESPIDDFIEGPYGFLTNSVPLSYGD